MGRVRDQYATEERLAIEAADRERREARKREIATSPKPFSELTGEDRDIAMELLSEITDSEKAAEKAASFMSKPTLVDPAVAEADAEKVFMAKALEALKTFAATEPLYNHQAHYDALAAYVTKHQLPANVVGSWYEAFSKLYSKLERPQPGSSTVFYYDAAGKLRQPTHEERIHDQARQQEQQRRDYYEKPVHYNFGQAFSQASLDAMSAEEYAKTMNIPRRAPLGSLFRSPVNR